MNKALEEFFNALTMFVWTWVRLGVMFIGFAAIIGVLMAFGVNTYDNVLEFLRRI